MAKIGRDAFLYLEPAKPMPAFAQCETCNKFSGSRCVDPLALPVTAGTSCGFYAPGTFNPRTPISPLVTAKAAGLVVRPVRCENCRYSPDDGGDDCKLYVALNKAFPEDFALDTKIKAQGCCNANMPKESGDGDEQNDGGASAAPQGYV